MTWSAERYFVKAQIYWEKANARGRQSDDFLLNVAFFCEFLVRGTICSLNPALNSAMDNESLLYAAGVTPNTPESTISLTLAMVRLVRILPEITEDERTTISTLIGLRNQELHGDNDAFSGITEQQLLPMVFSFAVKVAAFAKQDLEALFGRSDAIHAKKAAEASAKNRKDRVRNLIRIQKDRFFELSRKEHDEKRNLTRPKFSYATTGKGHRVMAQKCPSCASLGLLGGAPSGRSSAFLVDGGIQQEVRVTPEIFKCECCGLEIRGLDELMAAGFDHEFRFVEEVDVVDHFGIDPMDYVDTDEIIRQYNSQFEYMDE